MTISQADFFIVYVIYYVLAEFYSVNGDEGIGKIKTTRLLWNLVVFWRRERDSNPRGIAPKLISSQPRYDHFDISAKCMLGTKCLLIYYTYFLIFVK